MKVSTVILSILPAALLALNPGKTQAFPVSYNPDVTGAHARLSAKIPLEKLGSVSIPRGRLKLKGNMAEVSTVQEFMFDHEVILSGPVINTQETINAGKVEITGLAYFAQGDWLVYLSPAAFQETVVTNTEELTGRIMSIDNAAAEIRLVSGQQVKILLSSIKDIHSPRAFRFTISGTLPDGISTGQPYETEANKLAMQQTARQFRVAALKSDLRRRGDGDLTTGQLVAIGTLISSIEIGQMVPFLVVPLMYNRLHQTAFRKEFDTVTSPINISPSISVPNYLVPPPPGVMPSPNLTR